MEEESNRVERGGLSGCQEYSLKKMNEKGMGSGREGVR